MKRSCVYANGTPVPSGHCITPDSTTDTFIVKVRSLGGVGIDQIKSLLQAKHEVLEVEHLEEQMLARYVKRFDL